ncbi:reverse transcriptase family protein [Propioniciclava sinopodophylli]|uniref:reverse transcriptase family protein n=1 Tax=Propioniciclava sinopodophylli TaxID=1837344 RepID=UPI002492776C|nr:reverse transcriptase family protein [Propioniciclava sinopodophylli]
MTDDLLRRAGLTSQHLELLAKWFAEGRGYRSHLIRKRHGGVREIFEASTEFDSILKLLRRALEQSSLYCPPECVHGYVKGRNIVTNASQHLAKRVVLCVDVEDFFPAISTAMVASALKRVGLGEGLADLIANAVTVAGQLPAGFSTSPFLSNVVFEPTDSRLLTLADPGVAYTRYADDLTFSGDFSDEVLLAVREEMARDGWSLRESKTRFMRQGGPQYVTGLYVGAADRPHVPRRIKRRLRQQLYYMGRYGFASAWERGEVMYQNQAGGWVRYVAQVEPRAARRLEELLELVDFRDDYLYWSDPDDWNAILDDVGLLG